MQFPRMTRRAALSSMALAVVGAGLPGCSEKPRKHQATSSTTVPGAKSARETLGEYLTEEEPLSALWRDMVRIVYHKSSVGKIERLKPAAQTLYYVECFQGEIVNGGISQFFSNSSGNCCAETLAALREIGAPISVELLEKALTLFPEGKAPADRSKRCELLFAFEEREPQFLEELTKTFYQRVYDGLGGPSEENLNDLKLAFIRANSAQPVRAVQPSSADPS